MYMASAFIKSSRNLSCIWYKFKLKLTAEKKKKKSNSYTTVISKNLGKNLNSTLAIKKYDSIKISIARLNNYCIVACDNKFIGSNSTVSLRYKYIKK